MTNRTVGEIARVCDGTLYNCSENQIASIFVNNDKCIVDNCCYVAIKGDKYDGADYAENAVKSGAAVVLSERRLVDTMPCIVVKSIDTALLDIAEHFRKKELGKVVAVTGSVGKTTVKELCACVLSTEGSVLKTDGNKNNLLGLPLTVLSNEGCRTAVLEAGISEVGEMEKLSRVSRPDVAVITNVGVMHAETLKNREITAREKLKIISANPKSCILVAPYGEPLLLSNDAYATVTVGINEDNADYSASGISFDKRGTFFDVSKRGKKEYRGVFVPILGLHGVLDALFAIAVGEILGVCKDKIKKGISEYKAPALRQNIIEKNGITVMCDCYNCGPSSLRASLDAFTLLVNQMARQKRILVLGSMLELGDISESEHIAVGKYLSSLAFDTLITFGNEAKNIALGALIGGMEDVRCYGENERKELQSALRELCKSPCTVLIKGSRRLRMEELLPSVLGEDVQ